MKAFDRFGLVELQRRAIALQNQRRPAEAVEFWSELLRREPSWDHGYADYGLACCLEDVGALDEARRSFQRALSHDSNNPIFLGGYASFLFMHGSAREAFDKHCELLALDLRSGDTRGAEIVEGALATLGHKLELTEERVRDRIREVRATVTNTP